MDLPDCFDCKYGGLEHPCRCADGTYDFVKAGAAIVARGRLFGDDGEPLDARALEAVEWITDCEFELVEDHPHLILPLAIAAMDACETPEDAAFLAAGLLESGLVKHGPQLIAGFQSLASRSAKVRYILSGIWSQGGSMDRDVWSRLGKAIGAGPRMSSDGRSAHDGSPIVVPDPSDAQALLVEPITLLAVDLGLVRR